VQWLNPLHYQLKWADSTFTDESDAAVQSFISKLTEQFGSPVTSLNKDQTDSKAAMVARVKEGGNLPSQNPDSLHFSSDGFKSLKLTFLYLQLQQSNLTPTDIKVLNALEPNITKLDKLNGEDIASKADEQFKNLFTINTAQDLISQLPDAQNALADLETYTFKSIEAIAGDITKALPNLSLSNTLLATYYKATITDFVSEATKNLAANRALIKKFDPIIALLKTSVSIAGDVPNTTPGVKTEYYKDRDIKLADGKGLHTTVSLVEKEYDATTHEYKVKSETQKAVMQFRKYDPVTVFVSTGGFYANTSLKNYGTDKDMKVTEDVVDKDNFVTAAFLNFAFVPSRYVSPLVQLGIDPTKKHPFMLLGGGFAIPVAKIALTAGGVWTWDASLKTLTVGKEIGSTTDLDKDVTYKFSMQPKGWYLGIQYNF
jgi:hypothetical protein